MKLGSTGNIIIGSIRYDQTVRALATIGFKTHEKGVYQSGLSFQRFMDGRQHILVNQATDAIGNYRGLIYYDREVERLKNNLHSLGVTTTYSNISLDGMISEFQTENGVRVFLSDADAPPSPSPTGSSQVEFGNFGEFAIHVKDLNASIQFWEKMGMRCTYSNEEWQFAILTDDILVIGVHSHDLKYQPAISYFHPDNPAVVGKLKAKGVEFVSWVEYETNNKPAVDAVTQLPDGSFLFLLTGNV